MQKFRRWLLHVIQAMTPQTLGRGRRGKKGRSKGMGKGMEKEDWILKSQEVQGLSLPQNWLRRLVNDFHGAVEAEEPKN